MHEEILLLKKIADYFNKIQKLEIANIINEELQKQVEKNPDFCEPEYAKDDLPTIFFRHVTLKRRKSEISMRKSMGNNNSKSQRKSKKSVTNVTTVIEPQSLNVIVEDQENIIVNNNPVETVDETSHSILAPINTNRISENIARKSQFIPDIGSTPIACHARAEIVDKEIKLENVDADETVNNYEDDDGSNSLIMYDPEENFHQTIHNSNHLDMNNDYDISNFDNEYEAYLQSNQLDFITDNAPNIDNIDNGNILIKQSMTIQEDFDNISNGHNQNEINFSAREVNFEPNNANNEGNLENFTLKQSVTTREDLNNSDGFNQSNQTRNLNEEIHNEIYLSTENRDPGVSNDGNLVLKQPVTTQEDLDNSNGHNQSNEMRKINEEIKINLSNVDDDLEITDKIETIDNNSVTDQISNDENSFNSQKSPEFSFDSTPFQCGQRFDDHCQSLSIDRLSQPTESQDLFENDHDDKHEILKVTNEIAIQCDPIELYQQLDRFEFINSNGVKRFIEVEENNSRKKRKLDMIDLDVEEANLAADETIRHQPVRCRNSSLSSLESLPAPNTETPQSVKLKKRIPSRATIIFKENKKLDIKRRILLSDGWIVWPNSLLSGCLKHYDEESFVEVIESEFDNETALTRRDLLKIYLENMCNENLLFKFHHSGKKLDLFLKLSTLPEDLLDSLDISLQVYNDNLWNKNLGPKNGRRLCAEGAPQIVKDLLNMELDFINNLI